MGIIKEKLAVLEYSAAISVLLWCAVSDIKQLLNKSNLIFVGSNFAACS